VTLEEMTRALVWAVENPPAGGTRVLDVPAIRRLAALPAPMGPTPLSKAAIAQRRAV
jgi:hypothetical protein